MSVSFFSVSLDCADAGKLADFWSQVLDRPVDEGGSQDFASIGMSGDGSGQPVWMFHRVPEAKQAKNRVHVDFISRRAGGRGAAAPHPRRHPRGAMSTRAATSGRR